MIRSRALRSAFVAASLVLASCASSGEVETALTSESSQATDVSATTNGAKSIGSTDTTEPATTESNATETTESDESDESSETQETASTERTDAVTTTGSPPTTAASQTTQDEATTQAPGTTQASATTQATQTTQAPGTTQATVTTQAPATTQAPVTTQAPATTQAPVTTQAPTTTEAPVVKCLIRLHGKGGGGSNNVTTSGDISILRPNGNGTGWGGRQWEYETSSQRSAAFGIITTAANNAGCTRIVVNGFSNGASMAAALLCSGTDLNGRLVGVIIDDPVTDAATIGCSRSSASVAIYWTGALANAAAVGTNCDSIDWTCAGEVIRGINAYSSDIGVSVTASPFSNHQPYTNSPLPATWLG